MKVIFQQNPEPTEGKTMTRKTDPHAATTDEHPAESQPKFKLSPQAQQAAKTAALIAADSRITPLRRVLSAKRESWDKPDREDLE